MSYVLLAGVPILMFVNIYAGELPIRDGPFDIQGGGWDFFEKNSLFPNRGEKNKMSSTKLKIKILFFIQHIFSKPFSLGVIKFLK